MRGPRTANGQPVPRIAEVPYSTFLSQVKSGGVEDAQLSVTSVAYRSKDGLTYFARIPRAPPDLVNVLDAHQARRSHGAARALRSPRPPRPPHSPPIFPPLCCVSARPRTPRLTGKGEKQLCTFCGKS